MSEERPIPGIGHAVASILRAAGCFVAVAAALLAVAGWAGRWSILLDGANALAPLTFGATFVAGVAVIAGARRGRARILLAALMALGAAAAASRLVPEWRRQLPGAPIAADNLRVLSFNVWNDNPAPTGTVEAIARTGADVVLLQEADGTVGDALPALARRYPYRAFCPTRCGLTILSRRPLLASGIRLRHPDRRIYGSGLLWAVTPAPDGAPVMVATVHYRHHNQERVQAELVAALANISRRSLILAGDMNLTPWTYSMARQDGALAPLVRHTQGLASWPARLGAWRLPVPLLAIDQVYAGPDWRQLDVARIPAASSDHYGILATFSRTVRRG